MSMDDDELEELFKQHEPLFKAKDKVLKILHKFDDVNEITAILSMVITDFAIHGLNSEDEAIEMASVVAAKSAVAIKAFSSSGLCAWNATRQ